AVAIARVPFPARAERAVEPRRNVVRLVAVVESDRAKVAVEPCKPEGRYARGVHGGGDACRQKGVFSEDRVGNARLTIVSEYVALSPRAAGIHSHPRGHVGGDVVADTGIDVVAAQRFGRLGEIVED